MMFQRQGQGVSFILKHRRAHFCTTLNTLNDAPKKRARHQFDPETLKSSFFYQNQYVVKLMSALTGHLRLGYYGTQQFQGLVQFSETDFGSPMMKSSIASAVTIPVKLDMRLSVTIRDKSPMIVASLLT